MDNNNNNIQQPFSRNQHCNLLRAIFSSQVTISSLEPDSQVHQEYKHMYSENGRLVVQCTEQGGLCRPVVGWESLVVTEEQ